jgi:hypothetical protein
VTLRIYWIIYRLPCRAAIAVFLLASALSASAQELIVYEKPVHLNRIAGTVVDANGSPISGAQIELRSATDGTTLYSTASDARGKFSFARGTVSTPVKLWIHHDLFKPVQYTVGLRWFAPGQLRIVLPVAT